MPQCVCSSFLCMGEEAREAMRSLLLLFFCLAVVGCMARTPHRCRSPPLMSGSLTVSVQSGKFTAYAKYIYDAVFKRIRLGEIGSHENKTFRADVLLLFQEGVMYKINHQNRSCCKKRLKADFHPLAIPKDASLLGQAVLGSSSGPRQGLLVNTWWGELERKRVGKAKYLSTVTEFGCVPVSTLFHTDKQGWMVTSFFNNVRGITDPQLLIPPPFCKDAQLQDDDGEEPDDFYSLFSEY